MTTRIQHEINKLKLQTGALSFFDEANLKEGALIAAILQDSLWINRKRSRAKAVHHLTNFIRHNAMLGLVDAITSAMAKNPQIPLHFIMLIFLEELDDAFKAKVEPPILKLKDFLISRLSSLQESCIDPTEH